MRGDNIVNKYENGIFSVGRKALYPSKNLATYSPDQDRNPDQP